MMKRIVTVVLAFVAAWGLWRLWQERMAGDAAAGYGLRNADPFLVTPRTSADDGMQVSLPPPLVQSSSADSIDVAQSSLQDIPSPSGSAVSSDTIEQERSAVSGERSPLQDSGSGTSVSGAAEIEDADSMACVGYCMHCKAKRSMVEAHEERTERGRRRARGMCSVCGTKIVTFLKGDAL